MNVIQDDNSLVYIPLTSCEGEGTPPRSSLIEYAVIFVALSGLFFFLFGPTLQAQLALVDDHEIIRFNSPEGSLWKVLETDLQRGRFRPLYYSFRFAEIILFGTNPQAWHIATISFGVLTCFLLYLAARKLDADIFSASLFAPMFVMTGSLAEIWYRLGPNETLGMVVLALSIWAIANAARRVSPWFWDGLALTAMALAGLTKESFVLVIPALLLLRWTLQCWIHQETWRQAFCTLRRLMVGGLLVFVVEIVILIVVMFYAPKGYGPAIVNLSLMSFDPRKWYEQLILSEAVPLVCYCFMSFTLLAVYWLGGKPQRSYLAAIFLIFAAWVIPQLVLYSNLMFGRYFFPAIVGIAAINLLTLVVVQRRRGWILWTLCVMGLLTSFGYGLNFTTKSVNYYTADTQVVHEMVTYLARKVNPNRSIVIAGDIVRDQEWFFSLGVHLRFAGSISPVYRVQDITASEVNNIGAIILLHLPDNEFPIWFIPDRWQEKAFSQPYYSLSIRELGYRKEGDVRYNVYEPVSD
ncbi:MAG: hypothetical protein HS126_13290 [Anaerolineales bacterium]|nr:hypothetical protein [Anaerolineales bacterium]